MIGRAATAPTLAAQLVRLNSLRLANADGAVLERGGKLRFDFSVQPFVGSREYRCRIELPRARHNPHPYVLSPDLQALADGRRPPHIYDYNRGRTRLCLFMPGDGEWHAGLWLSETIVPWTVEWLRYYELWLVNGVWHGGGEHPETEPRRRYGIRRKRS